MTTLEPRIEAVRVKYGLAQEDFWQIKQNKQWVCKHAALEIVAVKAGVEWSPPQIIEANAPGLVTSMIVTGKMDGRVEWATGETNPTNYSVIGKQPAYPWAMSEKRAKDRVVLKLVGIHGLVYSEDEMSGIDDARKEAEQPKKTSAAEQKSQLSEIDKDLLDAHSEADLTKLVNVWASIAERDGWSKDYWDEARRRFARKKRELADGVVGDVVRQKGGTVVDERVIRDSTGRELSNVEAA